MALLFELLIWNQLINASTLVIASFTGSGLFVSTRLIWPHALLAFGPFWRLIIGLGKRNEAYRCHLVCVHYFYSFKHWTYPGRTGTQPLVHFGSGRYEIPLLF